MIFIKIIFQIPYLMQNQNLKLEVQNYFKLRYFPSKGFEDPPSPRPAPPPLFLSKMYKKCYIRKIP